MELFSYIHKDKSFATNFREIRNGGLILVNDDMQMNYSL